MPLNIKFTLSAPMTTGAGQVRLYDAAQRESPHTPR